MIKDRRNKFKEIYKEIKQLQKQVYSEVYKPPKDKYNKFYDNYVNEEFILRVLEGKSIYN